MDGTPRQVVIRPGEDGYWIAECLSLPGCITQGRTRDEAIDNAKDAIRGYIVALEEDPRRDGNTLTDHLY